MSSLYFFFLFVYKPLSRSKKIEIIFIYSHDKTQNKDDWIITLSLNNIFYKLNLFSFYLFNFYIPLILINLLSNVHLSL